MLGVGRRGGDGGAGVEVSDTRGISVCLFFKRGKRGHGCVA